jgi:hypothetical protein
MAWFDRKSIISLIVEAVLFLGIISFGYKVMNGKLETSEQNLTAYKGQMEQLELKNGELIATRDSYILDKKNLEEALNVSKSEVKELERKLNSSLAYIANMESQVRIDTVTIVKDSIIYDEGDIAQIHFDYDDDWFGVKGTTDLTGPEITTSLYDIKMYVPIQWGMTDNYKIFVKSDNPYVSFTNLDGAVIDGSKIIPKQRKFGLSVQGGFGVNYDLIKKNLGVGPYLGVGVHWRLW